MKRFASQLALVVLSAVLLSAAFPPVDLGLVAWVGLVPYLAAVERSRRRGAVWWVYLHSAVFFTMGLWWMTVVAAAGLAVTVFHLGFFQMIFAVPVLAGRHRLRLPYLAVAPIAWVAAEFFRSFALTGYPWLYLGHTQWRFLELIQIADLAGAFGVSFVVVAVNAAIVDAWLLRGTRAKAAAIAVPVVLLASSVAYGRMRLGEADFRDGPVVAIVQGNIEQSLKVQAVRMSLQDVMDRHLELTLEAVSAPEKPDLVVWAETMVPGYLNVEVRFLSQASDLAKRHGTRLLLGSNAYDQRPDGDYRKANSVFYVDEQGRIADRYDKTHLVPVGEYNPYRDLLPRTNEVIYQTAGFLPDLEDGEGAMNGELPSGGTTYRFEPVICYELIFPELVRSYAAEDADFLVLLTNDAWWADSFEYEQFLAISVFRAIENRVSLVRCGNTGISGFIDPSGAIGEGDLLAKDGRTKNVPGVLARRVKIDDRKSPFLAVGDVFAKACLVAVIALAFVALVRGARPRKRS